MGPGDVLGQGPVDEFYEWETLAPKVKQPYAFRRAHGDPIVMAGLREWYPGVDGQELLTATIITTEAGRSRSPIDSLMRPSQGNRTHVYVPSLLRGHMSTGLVRAFRDAVSPQALRG